MVNPVQVADVAARFRLLQPGEIERVQAWLNDAWALVLSRRPLLETHVSDGLISEANVIRVIAGMVVRKCGNPEGKLEESIDDYSYRRDKATATGELYISPEELDDLTPVAVLGSKVRSVRLVAYGES